MYKQAAQMRLRIATSKGLLSIEDLFDLSLSELNSIAMGLNKLIKKSEEESFLDEETTDDELVKLKFNIVKDVLLTKKEAKKLAEKQAADKIFNAKILQKMAEKQDHELDNLTYDQLAELLR